MSKTYFPPKRGLIFSVIILCGVMFFLTESHKECVLCSCDWIYFPLKLLLYPEDAYAANCLKLFVFSVFPIFACSTFRQRVTWSKFTKLMPVNLSIC